MDTTKSWQMDFPDKYAAYVTWLKENNCIFPRMEYPVEFDEGLIGARAKYDIPPSKAFLFVSNKVIITAQKAKNSEIGFILNSEKHMFLSSEKAGHNTLDLFIMYEKLKGQNSFWYPYFETVDGMDLAMFWSTQHLADLQDEALTAQAQNMLDLYELLWKHIYEAISKYPQYFPGTKEELEASFRWAHSLVNSRWFAGNLPCSMVVPLADNLNHANVKVTTRLVQKDIHLLDMPEKYADFTNEVDLSSGDMPQWTGLNRLEKCLSSASQNFESVRNIWEIELLLYEYDSSTDSEENCSASEEDEEEAQSNGSLSQDEEDTESESDDFSWYDWNDSDNIYFTYLTGDRNSYPAGSQIFTSYGRRTNGFLILHYGFAMLSNIYDSLTLRTLEEQPLSFKLKYNKLLEELLTHVRWQVMANWKQGAEIATNRLKTPDEKTQKSLGSEVTAEFNAGGAVIGTLIGTNDSMVVIQTYDGCQSIIPMNSIKQIKTTPERVQTTQSVYSIQEMPARSSGQDPEDEIVELMVCNKIKELLLSMKSRFTTTQEQDQISLESVQDQRQRFALIHRIGQKRIWNSQLKMIEHLISILEKVRQGESIQNAHINPQENQIEWIKSTYPLREYLKKFYTYRKNHSYQTLPHIQKAIKPKTDKLTKPNPVPPKFSDKNERYLYWLRDNGCIFPRVQYPAKFGEPGIIGMGAKYDIPPSTAFLFVSHKIIITSKKAKNSEIGSIITKYKRLFRDHDDADDHKLYLYIMYESLKGEDSLWYPYFQIVEGQDLLMFWKDQEMDQLQNLNLKKSAQSNLLGYQKLWQSIYKIIKKYPTFFPGSQTALEGVFRWSYQLVGGRCFGDKLPYSMVVPLADNLNHANLSVTFELLHREIHLIKTDGKYKDFQNKVKPEPSHMPKNTGLNRLEKRLNDTYIDTNRISNIWEIDEQLEGYKSSSNSDDNDQSPDEMEEISEEEESEEQEQDKYSWYDWNDKENIFFAILTGARNSFTAGSEIFYCYGRRTNSFLLLYYGFAMTDNIYDSLRFRASDIRNLEILQQNDLMLMRQENTMFKLKFNQLNENFLNFFRIQVIKKAHRFPELEGFTLRTTFSEPFNVQVELIAIRHVKIVFQALQQRFTTSLEDDLSTVDSQTNLRVKFATIYRINQKKILRSQIDLLDTLENIMLKIKDGESITDAQFPTEAESWEEVDPLDRVKVLYPLRKYLKEFNRNRIDFDNF